MKEQDSYLLMIGEENSGSLDNRKDVNLPEASVDVLAMPVKVVQDLKSRVEQDTDMVLVSFIYKAADALRVKKVWERSGRMPMLSAKFRIIREFIGLM